MLASLIVLVMVYALTTRAASVVDFCHAEPRQRRYFPACRPIRHAVHVALIHENPYHALHDWIWAVTYYLLHCTQHRDVTLILNSPSPFNNVKQCAAYWLSPKTPKQYVVTWGVCVLHIVARSLNVDLEIIYNNTRAWPPGNGTEAVSVMEPERDGDNGQCVFHTYLGIEDTVSAKDGLGIPYRHFRGLDWYGRECSPKGTFCSASGLVKLPETYKHEALQTVHDAVRNFFNVRKRSVHKPVHVLLYDRSDALQRKWANALSLMSRLRNDPRVKVRFVQYMPVTLREQVDLYSWADIVIAPHGAAMANTVFMQEGGEIVEIWSQFCDMNVVYQRYRPRDWTGWHAAAIGLNLRYVQCHRADGRFKNDSELLIGERGEMTRGMHKVRVTDIFRELSPAITRISSNMVANDRRDGKGKKHGGRGLDRKKKFMWMPSW